MNTYSPTQTPTTPKPSFTPVSKGLLQRKCACGSSAGLTGKCGGCDREKLTLQRRATDRSTPDEVPPIVHEVLNSSGQPLDRNTRTFMESRFGHDFSQVRVHTDAKAAESVRAVNALAYTAGSNLVFGEGEYTINTNRGQKLIAHELAHVIQQAGNVTGVQAYSLSDEHHPAEREADVAAKAVVDGRQPYIALRTRNTMLHRHKDDLVAYSGGQTGTMTVLQAGKVIFPEASAVSGHPGHGENEPGEGPIPTGMYRLHPQITQPTVSKLQGGVCGANAISSGFQEITSNECRPCNTGHYCNVPCPTATDTSQKGFTPSDCWGSKRIKIEGSTVVTTSAGKKVTRDGFYIHGGNPADAVTSGCIKSLNDNVFDAIRQLTGVRGAVPLCVGNACPKLPADESPVNEALGNAATDPPTTEAEV
jgi:hypothetical protein